MATKAEKRKKIEDYVIRLMKLIDKTGLNEAEYRKKFASMSDAMFGNWITSVKEKAPGVNLSIYAPNLQVALTTDRLFAAADMVGLKLFERLKLYDSTSGRYYTTPKEYLVVTLPVRRLKQSLKSKLSVPESDKIINPLTGQVTKPDKGASISSPEIQTLDSKDLQATMVEMFTVRGGDLTAYSGFVSSLEETGDASLEGLDYGGVRSAKVARTLLQSMGLDNNL